MSFPEGPQRTGEKSAVDDSGDTVDPAPTDGGLIVSVLDRIRDHFLTWSDRYVAMRVEARTGRRE